MFKVEVKGFGNVRAQFVAATENVKVIVYEEMEGMAKEWVAGAKRDAPKDTGNAGLTGAISYKPERELFFEIVAQKFYAPFQEFGTKGKYQPIPGTENIAAQFKGYKGGSFSDMLKAIELWVARKGITGTFSIKTRKRTGGADLIAQQNRSAAWAIAMSILKNGVSPHPFFFKQQEIVWPKMVRRVKQRIEQSSRITVIMPSEVTRPKIITV